MQHITHVDNTLWALISRLHGQELQTPLNSSNTRFRITGVSSDSVTIQTGVRDTQLTLTRTAFQQTLDYLSEHRHFGQAHAVEIRSKQQSDDAGPLCQAARRKPDGKLGTVVITYILPILEQCHAVGIQRETTPTSTWLLP